MLCSLRPVFDRGRFYAFPAVWAAVFATGVGWREPVNAVDAASFLAPSNAQAPVPTQWVFFARAPPPPRRTFVRDDLEPEEAAHGVARRREAAVAAAQGR